MTMRKWAVPAMALVFAAMSGGSWAGYPGPLASGSPVLNGRGGPGSGPGGGSGGSGGSGGGDQGGGSGGGGCNDQEMRALRFHAIGDVVLGGYVPGGRPQPLSGATVTVSIIAPPRGVSGVDTSKPTFDVALVDGVPACERSVLIQAVATYNRGNETLTSQPFLQEVSVDQLMSGGSYHIGTLTILDHLR